MIHLSRSSSETGKRRASLSFLRDHELDRVPVAGVFTFFHKMVGNNLMTRLTLNINRVIFSVEEYSDLNQLFGKIAELSTSRKVLKKVN